MCIRDSPESGTCEYGVGSGSDPCVSGFNGVPAPVADWGMCDSYCEALGEAECEASDGCRAILGETCAPWLDCASLVGFVACWPIAPSGPVAPGGCDGLTSYECSRHNDCAAEHTRDWFPCGGTDPTTCAPISTTFLACHPEEP